MPRRSLFALSHPVIPAKSPRHSRESGNPQGGEQRLAARNQAPRALSRLCGRDARAPRARTCPIPFPCPLELRAALDSTRATRNGASDKTALTLQWGQRLSALETGYCVLGVACDIRLQWGQRLSALDTGHPYARYRAGARASMGPTPFSVGYVLATIGFGGIRL